MGHKNYSFQQLQLRSTPTGLLHLYINAFKAQLEVIPFQHFNYIIDH